MFINHTRSIQRRVNVRRKNGLLRAQQPLAVGAKVKNGTTCTSGIPKKTTALSMQHQHFMVVIDLLRRPIRRQLCLQHCMGRARAHRRRNQGQPLGHAMMVAVNR